MSNRQPKTVSRTRLIPGALAIILALSWTTAVPIPAQADDPGPDTATLTTDETPPSVEPPDDTVPTAQPPDDTLSTAQPPDESASINEADGTSTPAGGEPVADDLAQPSEEPDPQAPATNDGDTDSITDPPMADPPMTALARRGTATVAGSLDDAEPADSQETTTTLTSSLNPSSYGQEVMFSTRTTFTSDGAPVFHGSVAFRDGDTLLGSSPVSLGGDAQFWISSLSAGSHTITATFTSPGWSSSSDTVVQVVTGVETTTTLTSAPNPSLVSGWAQFTATVKAGGSPVNRGLVQFHEGTDTLGSPVVVDPDGTARYETWSLPEGTHTITADYLGSAQFEPSSASIQHTVRRMNTITTLERWSSSNPSDYGEEVYLRAVVLEEDHSPIRGGPLQFRAGDLDLGTTQVRSDGFAYLRTDSLPVGRHTITAAFLGTEFYAPSSASIVHVVNALETTTALESSVNPSVHGEAVTFTATITSDQPVTGGTVQFLDGSENLGLPVDVNTDGIAHSTTSTLTVGTHTITARYLGDTSHAESSASLDQTVTVVETTTTLVSDLNPSIHGDDVRFTATITSGAPITGGTVQFLVGTENLGLPVAVNTDGIAQIATSTLPAGTHTITARYLGDASHAESSASIDQTVIPRSTMTLTSSANPSVQGEDVTFTVHITPEQATMLLRLAASPSGSVQFRDGTEDLGAPVELDGDGTATFTTSTLTVGTHTITAEYSGTETLAASFGSIEQAVNPAPEDGGSGGADADTQDTDAGDTDDSLPNTGSDNIRGLAVATIGLVMLGWLLIGGARSRRRSLSLRHEGH